MKRVEVEAILLQVNDSYDDPKARNRVRREACVRALRGMPDEERAAVEAMAKKVSGLKGAGEKTALEILAAVGILWGKGE